MVTQRQLEPVIDTIVTATGAVRVDALHALVNLDLSDDQWRNVAPTICQLVEDPDTDLPALSDALVRVPLASVRRRLDDAAAHSDAHSRSALLSARHEAGDESVTADLVESWLTALDQAPPGTEAEAIQALACLPIERAGVAVDRLRPALSSPSPDTAIWAPIALARLGDTGPLDALLRRLANGDVPEFFHGNPFAAYEDLAASRPLPPAVRQHLVEFLDRLDREQAPHVCLVALWALTGVADAEGSPLSEAAPAPPSSPEPVLAADEGTVERARVAAADLLTWRDPAREYEREHEPADLANLTALPSDEAGDLLTEALSQARARVDKGIPGFMLGNELVHVADLLPRATGVDLSRVAGSYRNDMAPIPEDQLGWVLTRALDSDLMDQFGRLMRDDDTGQQAIATRLLRLTLEQRGRYAPIHGAGPSGQTEPAGSIILIEDEGWATAEPPAAMAEPATAMAEPPAAMAEPPAAMSTRTIGTDEPEPTAPADDTSLRRVHAEMFEEEGRRKREHTLRPGTRHLINVRIGPGVVGRGTFQYSIPESDIDFRRGGAKLQVILVTETPAGPAMTSRPLTLKKSGTSDAVDLPLDVPAGVKELRASVLVLQDANVLQSGRLRAPVAETDEPVNGVSWGFVRDTETAPPVTKRRKKPKLDSSVSFHVGGAGDALLVQRSGDKKVLKLADMKAFRNDIVSTLAEALLHDDVDGTEPGSEQQVTLLRRLARRGYALYDQLATQLDGEKMGPRIQLLSSEDEVVPLEFVYDFGMPGKNATLCKHWKTALHKGKCSCKPHLGDEDAICPLGFWGLRFIIERQLAAIGDDDAVTAPAGQLRPGNDTLPSLRRVLFAATSRVDNESKDQRERTLEHLTGLLGAGVAHADTWPEWHDALRTQRPGLILSLPHTEEVEGLVCLEIGKDFREVIGLTDAYVVPEGAPVGPVVFLLGCSTATSDVSWQSAAANFRRRGASLVVGTIVETLGRQTAPMARLLADQLWGAQRAKGKTMGEALQVVRRQLVASGATLGMSLVVFGQSGWLFASED